MKPKPVKRTQASPPIIEIDWNDIERQVRLLSRAGDDGVRLQASPEERLAEAQRLAKVYHQVGKPLPDTLAALV